MLRGVCDREDDAAPVGGGFQVEDEGEVSVERIRQVGASQLARVCIGAEDVAGAVVVPVDLGDLTWRGIPDQL